MTLSDERNRCESNQRKRKAAFRVEAGMCPHKHTQPGSTNCNHTKNTPPISREKEKLQRLYPKRAGEESTEPQVGKNYDSTTNSIVSQNKLAKLVCAGNAARRSRRQSGVVHLSHIPTRTFSRDVVNTCLAKTKYLLSALA